MKWIQLVVGTIGLVLAPLAVVMFFDGLQAEQEEGERLKLQHLEADLDMWLSIVDSALTGTSDESTRRLAGKPVFICMQENDNSSATGPRYRRSIDALNLQLPSFLFPKNSEDVGVIAALYWSQDYIGDYDGGSEGYRERCTVRLYDVKSRMAVAESEFVGGLPPDTIVENEYSSGTHTIFGTRCDDDILTFVRFHVE